MVKKYEKTLMKMVDRKTSLKILDVDKILDILDEIAQIDKGYLNLNLLNYASKLILLKDIKLKGNNESLTLKDVRSLSKKKQIVLSTPLFYTALFKI